MLGRRLPWFLIFSLLVPASPLFSQGDPAVIARIIDEGKNRNQVMEHLRYLTHEIGPRLTGSPKLQRACEWTAEMFRKFGLQNVRLEKWGEVPVGFDRGSRQIARMVAPERRDFEFTTRAWSAGTNGLVRGKALLRPQTLQELENIRPLLKGAFIVVPPTGTPSSGSREEQAQIDQALNEAGIAGRVTVSRSELVLTSGSWRNVSYENPPKDLNVIIRKSDGDAIISHLAEGKEVILEFDIENRFLPGPVPVYNVIAEIPGTEKPEEVVIVSGHLDSWDGPGSQGCCDNGTGTMVALEAARLLMVSGAKPKRTIRFIMWTGEEQGLLGSRAYVEMHRDELDKISAVFVDDGGTNYSGGLICIEPMAEILRRATAPVNEAFPDMPIEIRVQERMPRGGGSDHASFNAVGVPGFFWIEKGRANYTYVHHTQYDRYDQAIPEYLIQSSVAAAVTAYNLACAETLLPREQAPRSSSPPALVGATP
jgi:hypothetical protein